MVLEGMVGAFVRVVLLDSGLVFLFLVYIFVDMVHFFCFRVWEFATVVATSLNYF